MGFFLFDYHILLSKCLNYSDCYCYIIILLLMHGLVGRGRPRAEYMTKIMKDMNKGNYKDLKEVGYNK